MSTWVAIIYLLLGGFAGALQVRILGNVETKVGIMGNMFVNFTLGLLFTLLIVSVYSLMHYQNPIKFYTELPLEKIKTWEYSAGLLGIIIVTSLGFAAPRIGVSGTILIFLFSQIILGLVVDHFGFLGVESITITPIKMTAIAIMFLGVYLFFR